MAVQARAFWVREPGVGEIRSVSGPRPGAGRGAGAHAALGRQPGHRDPRLPRRRARRPARGDAGPLPGGRASRAGEVRLPQRRGRRGRARPTCSAAPSSASTRTRASTSSRPSAVEVVPPEVPPARAVLAGTVETAVNALWDAAPLVGDRVTVVGAGMVGLCTARLLAGIPGVEVTVVDVEPERAAVARALGVAFALPADAPGGQDLTVHASATSAGLQLALDVLAPEGTVLDLSWYGDTEVTLRLGGAFHSEPAGGAGQPGGHGLAGAARAAQLLRPAAAWPCGCCATRCSTCCSPAARRSRSCRRSWPASPTARCRPCATPSPTRRRRRVHRDRSRPHDGGPQPAR